jgi:hypothetical protein
VRKKDVGAIEYYLRRGGKMLDAYQGPGTGGITPESMDYPMNWFAKGGKNRPKP